MINTFKKSLLFFATVLAASNLWAATETHPSSASSGVTITGTSYSIDGTFIAGQGGTKAGSMQTKGIKFRLNRSVGTINNAIEFQVISGYTITQIDFCGHVNDNTKTSTVTAVTVDGSPIQFSPVDLPAKTSSASFSISGISATQSIVMEFSGAGSQANLEYTVTYSTGGGDTPGGDTPGGDTPGGDTPGGDTPTPPAQQGELHFWFFNPSDATANNVTNDATVFSNMVASSSSKAGTITVDGVSYSITKRTGDTQTFGSFTIPANYTANFYALAISSGDGARQINLINGETRYEIAVPGGSSDYKQIEQTGIPAGTYSVEREGSNNVRMGVIILKFISSEGGGGGGDIPSTPTVTSVSISPASATLEVNGTQQLTATVVASPDEAGNKNVTWTSSDLNVATVNESGLVTAVGAGTATITATSTIDNTKSATSAITVNTPSVIVPVEGVSLNISTTTTITVGETLNLIATINPSNATNKAVTWSSTDSDKASVSNTGVVTGIAVGSSIIKVTTVDGNFEAQCVVIVDPAPTVSVTGVSLNKHALGLQVGQSETLVATISPNNATNKAVSWSSSNSQIASVSNNGTVTGVAVGTATITVTTEDGNKTDICAVDVTAGTPVPPTTLTLHTPGVYEDGTTGYGTDLVAYNSYEYEVYYMTRDGESKFCIATTNADKTTGITTRSSDYACTANDGWFKFSGTGWSSSSDAMGNEFGSMSRRLDMDNSCEFSMHIKGYDQFRLVARDKKQDTSSGQTKPDDNRYLEVYIDDVLQPLQFNSSPSVRTYDIPTSEHVIRVKHKGSEKSAMYAFSLRLAQEPSVKWIKGNDSTQTIRATEAMRIPIQYQTKYNNLPGASTTIQWLGNEPTGITFDKISTASGALKDTFAVRGIANCPAGTYNYAIVSTFNGRETSRIPGSFSVYNEIRPSSNDSVLIFKDEEMDPVTFRYYAANENDVHLVWGANGKPDGITNKGDNGTYYISGTPTVTGFFPFSISIEGADTVFYGQLEIKDGSGADILFLYKNSFSGDGIYNYIKSKYSISERQAKKDGLRPASQYAKYKWVLISEDVDANNHEVIELVRGGSNNLPILNLKGFTYSKDSMRLGWGDPNNGAIDSAKTKNAGCSIILERAEHPIFKKLTNPTDGKSVKIIEDYKKNGIMPITINNMPGSTTCLATAYTRGENYYDLGPLQTAIHEIPSDQRGGKYICLPIARQVTLTTAGKQLIDGIIEYLLSPVQATIEAPELRIDTFTVAGINADIDEGEKTIKLKLTVDQFKELDSLRAAKPEIVLADPHSHVTPASGEEVNLQYSIFLGTSFEVTDYINRVVYEFKVQLINPQGIEEVYEAGQWVNVFDIFGRKIATTNEDIYSMSLPHGIYIVVTESGNTLKIMR